MISCCDSSRSALATSFVRIVATLTRPSTPAPTVVNVSVTPGSVRTRRSISASTLLGRLDRSADRRFDLDVELVLVLRRDEFLAHERRDRQAADEDRDRAGDDQRSDDRSANRKRRR